MRAVGLITEYNPFHNGHLHHLRHSLELSGADVAVAVMSGHFLQRGEPALVDKWVRAQMALAAGVDLVIELPLPWACNSAPQFASGAVRALDALGGVESLCFGSESGDLAALQRCAAFLWERDGEISEATAALLRQGLSYPLARTRVAAEMAPEEDYTGILGGANNILGLAYLRALRSHNSSMRPLTLQRVGAGYHEEEAVAGIASATGIRRMIRDGKPFGAFVPEGSCGPLRQALEQGCCLDLDCLHRLLLARILRGAETLRGIYQVDAGIEERLFAAAECSEGYAELVDGVKSRQFTRTRIQRLLCYVLNEVRAEEMDSFLNAGPLYLHVLGFSERGRQFLAAHRKTRSLPLVQNYSRIRSVLRKVYGKDNRQLRLAERMLAQEVRASRTYTLLQRHWPGGPRGLDFYREVLREG